MVVVGPGRDGPAQDRDRLGQNLASFVGSPALLQSRPQAGEMPSIPGADTHQVVEDGDRLLTFAFVLEDVGEVVGRFRAEHPRGRVVADGLVPARELLERACQVVIEPDVACVNPHALPQHRLGLGPGPDLGECLAQQVEADRRRCLGSDRRGHTAQASATRGRVGNLHGVAKPVPPRVGVGQPGGCGQPQGAGAVLELTRRIAAQSSSVMARAVAISGGAGLDPATGFLGGQGIDVDISLAERFAVGDVGGVALPVVGPGRADVGQPVNQPAIARGLVRGGGRPASLGGDRDDQVFDLLAHARIDPRDQEVACLVCGGHRGVPRGQVAHRRSMCQSAAAASPVAPRR